MVLRCIFLKEMICECWQHCKMTQRENYIDKHNLQQHHQGISPSWSLKTLQHAPFASAGKTCWGTSKAMYARVPAGRVCVQDTYSLHFSGLSECLGPSVTEMYVQKSFSRYHWWLPPCTLLQVSYNPHFLNSHGLHHSPPSLARTTSVI